MKHMDYIYFEEDYYNKPKEAFEFICKLMQENIDKNKSYSILDIGCARGEFLYFAKKRILNLHRFTGIDYSEDLIRSASSQEFLSGMTFVKGDGENFSMNEKFNFITSLGVVGYFDNLGPTFRMIRDHLQDDGTGYVFHLFNPFDIDVILKYRNNRLSDKFQVGWNLHSIETAKKTLKQLDMKLKDISRFELSFDDEKKDDPARSWTINTDEGRKFTTGLGQIYSLYCLEVQKQ